MTNLTILTGRITKDLELKQAGQTQVTNFSLAVDNPFKKDDTSFFDIVAFGKTAELLNNYCGKGSKILIEGNLKQDRFQDKEGNNRSVVRVIANRIEFLDSKGSNQQNGQPQQQRGQATAGNNPFDNGTDIDNSDLPF
ncbi:MULTISPECIES: single-stranded DNA-binding protein [Bacilli]|uniref:single-stranded DNA-binding protein n=1 Tax=Staphylococcus phage IME-SA4 TaxID=1610872 RepID=UPI0005DA410F|nr:MULTISPECIES: single-stranded DNA-binding protein [Bacilli]YP_009219665.1 single-stranded DNA-binding protein [Staphylococcus phage IME-SA4]UDI78564.1 single-stranded DNA-binding protein [Staphylococcus taiwanensis]HDN2211925.1 single-stranded DNA-binding protein [Staphylococcus aureus]AJT61518.1 single-stranded DNA-binding protein [Staphylococcus phage IME-SA4]MBE9446822.1 single-stranded DNA-binding protein [Enterococcus faecalis]MBF2216170.1 single-stranded DNA-binding protein [Staphylo